MCQLLAKYFHIINRYRPHYPTLLTDNGARHQLGGGLYLGNGVDADPDGQPGSNADGDDNDGNVDEQGVHFPGPIIEGADMTQVEVSASVSGLLDAWIDFNADGDWNTPFEQIFVNMELQAGINLLNLITGIPISLRA